MRIVNRRGIVAVVIFAVVDVRAVSVAVAVVVVIAAVFFVLVLW